MTPKAYHLREGDVFLLEGIEYTVTEIPEGSVMAVDAEGHHILISPDEVIEWPEGVAS